MPKPSSSKEVFNPKQTKVLTTLEAIIPGVFAGCASLFFLVCCPVLFLFTKALLDKSPLISTAPIDWSFLGSITGAATFALILGGLIFAFIDHVQSAVQRKREASESSFNMYKEMYDRLMNPESIAARRWVIMNLPTLEKMNNDKDAWMACIREKINEVPVGSTADRAPGKEYMKRILNDLDFIGFVNKNYWTMENEMGEWMSSPVAKVWERIYQYVKEEADERKEKDYYESARIFGDYCVKWRKKNHSESIVISNGT